MNDVNKKIDRHLRKVRFKNILGWIGVIVPLTLAYVLINMPSMGEKETITGEFLTISAVQHDAGQSLFLVIEIEPEIQVRVFIPNSSFYKQGEVVKLLKIETLIYGKTSYKFRGYVQ